MIETTIDERSISALIRVLQRVRADNGNLDDHRLWHDTPSDDQFKNLRELKSHKNALLRLHKSIAKAIDGLQSSCEEQRLESGVNNSPEEVLRRIFWLSQPTWCDGLDQAISLSHVCQHFRSVALEMPSLWASTSLGRPIKQIQECLKRSGSLPITVFMDESACYFGMDSAAVMEFLAVVTPHAHRWSVLHVGQMVQAGSTNIAIFTKYPIINLPLLTELTHGPSPVVVDPSSTTFFRSWMTPKLKSYQFAVVCNVTPHPHIFRSPITRFSFSWSHLDNPSIDIVNILKTLAMLPAVEELEMRFQGVYHTASDSLRIHEPVSLPSVKSLSLTLGFGGNPDVFLTSLLNLAELPNVTSLRYSLRQLETSPVVGHLIYAPDGVSRFKKLENLDIYDDTLTPAVGILESILSGCPSLLHLSLCLPIMSLFGFDSKPEVWSSNFLLQTLHLKACDGVSSSELDDLIFNIRGSPSWNAFQRLEVHHCKYLTEHIFLSLEDFMEGKLVWTDCTFF